MSDFPKIISVVITSSSPRPLADRLPAGMRAKPRQQTLGRLPRSTSSGARSERQRAGRAGYTRDRLIRAWRHVAIPSARPRRRRRRFDRSKCIAAMTCDEMRPGCYEPKARVDDLALAGVDGSARLPHVPCFCGQTFMRRRRHPARVGVRLRHNDWMIEDWCDDSGGADPLCLIHSGTSSSRWPGSGTPGGRAICRIPTHLGLPSIHIGYWDPLFAICQEARGCYVCASDRRRRCRRRRPTRRPRLRSSSGSTMQWRH